MSTTPVTLRRRMPRAPKPSPAVEPQSRSLLDDEERGLIDKIRAFGIPITVFEIDASGAVP